MAEDWAPVRTAWNGTAEWGPLAWDVISGIRRFHRFLRTNLDHTLAETGLSFAQFEVMELLHTEPKLHSGELARRLHLTRQAVHRLVSRLERSGLVELFPLDAGIRCAWLTPAGRTCLLACRKALEDTEQAIELLPSDGNRRFLELLAGYERSLAPRPRGWWLE